jgi:hypothetical protein
MRADALHILTPPGGAPESLWQQQLGLLLSPRPA